MRAHLLNWALGPAFLAGVVASAGADPLPAPPTAREWLALFGAVGRIGAFFAGGSLFLIALVVVIQRLIEGRRNWPEVRLFAAALLVKVGLVVFVLGALIIGGQLALVLTGGWRGGWGSASVGALVGAAVGVLLGLAVAALNLPRRLGLDRDARAE